MGQFMINGAKYAISTVLSDSIAISAIANAVNPTVTAASTPDDLGIALTKSNWSDLNGQAFYTTKTSGTQFVLAGLDTSDTKAYPPDEALPASFQIPSGFTSISQIRTLADSGGDTNTYNFGYVDSLSSRQMAVPTDQNPLVLTFTLDFDPELPWYDALIKLSNARKPVVLRETLTTGDRFLYCGYISFKKTPSHTRNENMTNTATMTINSDLYYPASFFEGS